MTSERFWVVGGDYDCMGFDCLKDGSGKLFDKSISRHVKPWYRSSEPA